MAIDTSLANDVWMRYQYVRDNGHLTYVRKAKQCEDFFSGLQWNKEDMALLKVANRPALTINKIISTMSNVMGEQIFNRTETAFKPRGKGAQEEVADALTKVFMQIGDNNQLAWVRSDVFADGIITSRGFYDVRLDFNDSLQGEVRITQLNPKNVLVDPDAEEYDPDQWGDVIVTKWMSPDQIEQLYSKDAADALRGRVDSYWPYGYDSIDNGRDRFGPERAANWGYGPEAVRGITRNLRVIERQHRKLAVVKHFVDMETGDLRQIPDDWKEEDILAYLQRNPKVTVTKKQINRIRWTTICENYVLHDDWSPYKHFTVVPYFPYFRRGRTVGLVENLLGPQELLNKVSSQELHVVNTTANSGWKIKRNALKNMTVAELEQKGAQTGLVLELDEIDSAEKIQPNQTPTGLDRISYKAEEHLKTISGVSDYMTGFAREDVAAKAVKANQQRGSANLAKVMDNLNRTDFLLARNILDLVQEYYTEQRLVRITTDRLTNATQELIVNEVVAPGVIKNDLTLGEYAVVITNQPERDTFEDTQFEQALMLRTEAGVQIPDDVIVEASRLKNKAEIVKRMRGDQDSPEAQRQAALKARAQEAEVSGLEAEARVKHTDAQLKQAKAMKEIEQAKNEAGAGGEAQVEMQKAQMEAELERDKIQMEMDLKRWQMQEEMALKREQMAAEMMLKKQQMEAEMAIKAELAKKQAMAQRTQAAMQATASPKNSTAA